MRPRQVTALLLAGSRPGIDPLAAAFGASLKALVPVAGEAMAARVLRTLAGHPAIGRVIVLAQNPAAIRADPDVAAIAGDAKIAFEPCGDSVSQSVADALARHDDVYPFLVTTADHPLLDDAILDAFLAPALASGADVVVGVVERRVLEERYPDNRRTWLAFRGGRFSGANLFLLAAPPALAALRLWRTIEQQRKRGRAVIAAFGPAMLLAVGLRLLSLPAALRAAGRKLGLSATAVEIAIPEACIDVDSPADHALATTILAARPARGAT